MDIIYILNTSLSEYNLYGDEWILYIFSIHLSVNITIMVVNEYYILSIHLTSNITFMVVYTYYVL